MTNTKTSYSVKVTSVSAVRKQLDITVPADVVKEELKAVYKAVKSSAAIPGFRKGAIPENVLKARFGDQVNEDVTARLIEGSYGPSLQEAGFAPLGHPEIDVRTGEPDGSADFVYRATIEINPKIEIEGYLGMELAEESTEVSDKEVEEGLNRLRESRGSYEDVDRPAGPEDLVVIDFEASVDGKVLDKGRIKEFPLIIGKVTPLPGMDEALKGASKGDKVETTSSFPANYSEGGLAGKEPLVKMKVKTVKELKLPALDDEFAKDLEADTLEQLREKIRTDLKSVKVSNERERLKHAILTTLIEKHEIEVPESLEKKYLGMILNKAVENIRAGKPNPGDANLSIDQLRERYRPMAVRSVKEDVILDSISEKEDVSVTPAELEEAVRHLADSRGISFDALMGRIEKEGALEVIKDGIRHEKVFEIILAASKGGEKWARSSPAADRAGKGGGKETEAEAAPKGAEPAGE
ncbi:MAG: trigger factor [Thermodesulfobacteriota bacterium]